ncbi:MAG: ABC transporter substrate-binding protein [Candidatus Caldarchaeum sp.]
MRVYNPYVGWIEFPDRPSRIVSLCPSATETLFMLGVGDRVVGVSSWCHRPREALAKPKVGSYTDVVEERLSSLRPELIITTTGAQREAFEKLISQGYLTYPIPLPKTVYDILSMVVEIGGLVGELDMALNVCSKLSTSLEGLRSLKRNGRLPKTYVEIDLGGPTIPGYFSHVTSALHLAGVVNVFADVPAAYLYGMKVEGYDVLDVVGELVRRNPDVIIYESKSFNPSPDEGMKAMVERGLSNLEAVRNGRVLTLQADTLAHYGPSFLTEAVKVCEQIWEIFQKT